MRARRLPLALVDPPYPQFKDPVVVRHRGRWHLLATAWDASGFVVAHAVADDLAGPWRFGPPVDTSAVRGPCVAASGAVGDGDLLRVWVQTAFDRLGARVEQLVSGDGGATWEHRGTALAPGPGEGVYDPDAALVHGQRCLVVSAFTAPGQPDLHLATADAWDGPWRRRGPLLRQQDVPGHNPPDADEHEWGLEGGQLLGLPDGRVLLVGVLFRARARPGTRQRLLLALADAPPGPYRVLGAPLRPPGLLGLGENGHGCAVLDGDAVLLLHQERSLADPRWRLGLARLPLAALPPPGAAGPAGATLPP